jgi:hypothetical protein
MNSDEVAARLSGLIDALASIEHERWAHWQQYMHSKGQRGPDGSLILPAELVNRWENQVNTPYKDLSEAEKESDREQVRRYLPLITASLGDPD